MQWEDWGWVGEMGRVQTGGVEMGRGEWMQGRGGDEVERKWCVITNHLCKSC